VNRLVVWGGLEGLESHRWIQRAFHQAANKLGTESVWLANTTDNARRLQAGDRVITADIFGEHLPYLAGVDYVLHNFDGSHPLCQSLEHTPERLLRLQVWTKEAGGEPWGPLRFFHAGARTLFQPWGTDLLAEEFLEPVFNPDSRDVAFVGAVWSDQHLGVELGNEAAIDELKQACAAHRLNFVHATHVSDAEQTQMLRAARLTPAVAGAWQVANDYLPCRAFKLPSYGCAMFSNVPVVNQLFYPDVEAAWSVPAVPIADQVTALLALGEAEYLAVVRGQQQIASQFTYRQSLEAIDRAFKEMQT
jgi:hypothetical protein